MQVRFFDWDHSVYDYVYVEIGGGTTQLWLSWDGRLELFWRVIHNNNRKWWQFGSGLRLWPLKLWVTKTNRHYCWELGPLTFEWMRIPN